MSLMNEALKAAAAECDTYRKALQDIANRAVRIREDKAVVGIEASFIERVARDALRAGSATGDA